MLTSPLLMNPCLSAISSVFSRPSRILTIQMIVYSLRSLKVSLVSVCMFSKRSALDSARHTSLTERSLSVCSRLLADTNRGSSSSKTCWLVEDCIFAGCKSGSVTITAWNGVGFYRVALRPRIHMRDPAVHV